MWPVDEFCKGFIVGMVFSVLIVFLLVFTQ